jgi:hypothetical protein
MTEFNPSLDDGRAARLIADVWERAGMSPAGAHRKALAMLLVYLLNNDPSAPEITLTYCFEAGRLREYVLRAEDDGRLLARTAFGSDGRIIEELPLAADETAT